MKQAEYTRKGSTIITLATGHVENHKSINKAKKASRKLQPRLGDGTVRMIPHKQKRVKPEVPQGRMRDH